MNRPRRVLLLLTALLAVAAPASAQEALGGLLVRGPGVVTVANRWFHLLGAEGLDEEAACTKDGQPYACGIISMGKLAELAAGKFFHCRLQQFNGDSRWWGTCIQYDASARAPAAGVPSINRQWVRSGWARAHTLHSDAYEADEQAARAAGAGLWAGTVPQPTAAPERLEGAARVADANTLVIDGVRVRLDGIDGPELIQSCTVGGRAYGCGVVARGFLMDKVIGKRIACTLRRPAGDDRAFGVCRDAGADATAATINDEMVREGWAMADRRGAEAERVAALELEAQRAQNGMWAGRFLLPFRWRQGER